MKFVDYWCHLLILNFHFGIMVTITIRNDQYECSLIVVRNRYHLMCVSDKGSEK